MYAACVFGGQAQAVAPATADYTPSDPQIAWYLAQFIQDVRAVPADPIVVRQNWLQAYDFTTTAGASALNEYARADDPFAKLGKQQVAVDVSSVIRASRARLSISVSPTLLCVGSEFGGTNPA
jgi:type IV secretory pathway TrbF-like protein